MGLAEPNLRVHAVGPHVDEVGLRQVPLLEGRVVVLPLLCQPGHRRRRQAGRAAEELLQRGHEVAGGQSVQVEQRQYLGDLRRLAAPGRQDRRGEPLAVARRLVDATVVYPGSPYFDWAGCGDHRAGPVVAVADHQAPPTFVGLGCQLGYIMVDFRFKRGGEHATGASRTTSSIKEPDWVEPAAVTTLSTACLPDPRCERGPTRRPSRDHREGTPSAFLPAPIHRFQALLRGRGPLSHRGWGGPGRGRRHRRAGSLERDVSGGRCRD